MSIVPQRSDWRLLLAAARRHRVSTFLIFATLGISIGVNLVLYDAVRQILFLPPAAVISPHDVARLTTAEHAGELGWVRTASHSYPVLEAIQKSGTQAAGASDHRMSVDLGTDVRQLGTSLVTNGYFALLGVRPAIGRFWSHQEPAVAVISHRLWQDRWNGEPDVLGKAVRFGDRSYQIIGVAARDFAGVGGSAIDVWLPMEDEAAVIASDNWRTDHNYSFLSVLVRAGADVPLETLAGRLTQVLRREQQVRLGTSRSIRAFLAGITERSESRLHRVARVLQLLALLLFLAACAAAANMLMGRLEHRKQALSVQLALGAPATALIRLAVLEGIFFAGAASMMALGIVGGFARTVERWLLPSFAWREDVITPALIGMTGASCLVAAFVVILFEWLETRRASPMELLSARSGRVSTRNRWSNPLVGVQALVAFLLICGSGLFVRSMHNLRTGDLGFQADRLLLVELDPRSDAGRPHNELYELMKARLRPVQGVADAAIATSVPLDRSSATYMHVTPHDTVRPLPTGGPYLVGVDEAYFRTLGSAASSGRTFSRNESGRTARVVVVNEAMRSHAWGGRNPVGSCLQIAAEPACFEVIGVVPDAKRSELRESATLQVYVPLGSVSILDATPRVLFVRTEDQAELSLATIASTLRQSGTTLGRPQVRLLLDLVDAQVREWRLAAIVFTAYGLLSLVVAGLSLTGVLILVVGQRRQEMALRRALGAGWKHIAMLAARDVAISVIVAMLAAGGLLALAWPHIAGLLYRIRLEDIATTLMVAAGALLGSIIIGVAIAFAESRLSPADALRSA